MILSGVLTMMMDYDTQFQMKPFMSTLKQSVPNIRKITKKYVRLLLPIGALRAISTAIVQKMLEIGIDIFERAPKSSVMIIIISFIGAIIGHGISVFFLRKRKTIAIIFTIIF
ncbi:MAG: hypothetical protein WCL18_08470 [bacterium]